MEDPLFPSSPLPITASQEKKAFSLSPFLRAAWVLVFLLFLGNLFLLFPSGTLSPPSDLDQSLEHEQDAFKRLSYWQGLWQQKAEATPQKYSSFDGLPIDPDSDERITSLMIDNFSLARPQHSGIRSASIVYEALVEGGITRLMLLFPYQELDRVGPIRSARDYFVDISEEYGGLYVHAGGSPQALDQLRSSDRVISIEEDDSLKASAYSFRDRHFDAPHNLFVDLLLTKLWAEDRGFEPSKPKKTWCFIHPDGAEIEDPMSSLAGSSSPSQEADTKMSSLIELNYSHDRSSVYFVQFQYDEASHTYKRYYGSSDRQPHMDSALALQVAPTNLVIQIAPSFLITGDEKERLDMHNVGEGKAYFFSNGEMIEGQWKKSSEASVTQFFDAHGEEICFSSGQIWVGILDDEDLMTLNAKS